MKKGIFHRQSSRQVMALIRSHGLLSRLQLTQMLGVTPSTITRVVNGLLEQNLIAETPDPERQGRKGFPAKLLRLVPESIVTAGVFFDPDRIFSCIADFDGKILCEEQKPINSRSFDGILSQAGQSIRDQTESLGLTPDQVFGCGVSYPGQHTEERGRILRTKQFADWPKIDVRNDLSPYFDMPVYHINDAKAACLAELYYGSCKSYQNFCYIWLSYGIGGAAVINRDLYMGLNQASAEFGGLFPKSQNRPSGQNLLDTLRAAGHNIERLDRIQNWHLELPVTKQWIGEAVENLKWLSLVIARTFAPQAIVFGGTLNSQLIDHLQSEVAAAERLGEDFLIQPPAILRAKSDTMPQLGAAALPINEMMNPSKFR